MFLFSVLTSLRFPAAGMKHLRDNNIMHRDLKPGNIMKFIGDNGTSIYKLTDFGAARELEDDQQFMSLYGTEEYLHPDLYERAVLRKSAGKTFKANFDLWSIGVTLFHIATGSLPFKPYGGRKNKETMYKITTEKASGIISGIQHSENGEIEWSRNLPKTCLLSPGFQQLVTKLLAGLMECHSARMWSFEQLFNSVTFILSHKVYHVFYVNSMKDVVMYVHPNETYNDLKVRLKLNTNIQPESQLLLWNKSQVIDINDVQTTPENPIILLNSDPTKMKPSPIMSNSAPKFPDLQITVTNCDQDAQLAKLSSSMAYSVQRIILKCVLYYNLAKQTPQQVICYIDGNVKLLGEKQLACSHLFNALRTQLQYLSNTASYLKQLKSKHNIDEQDAAGQQQCDSTARAQQLFAGLSEYWSGLSRKMASMSDKVKELNEKWNKEPISVSDANMASAVTRSKYYCQRIKESWQTLHKDKTNRILSMNEEQLHQLEKIKIENNCKKLSKLLCSVCYSALGEVTDKLEDWYTGAQVAIVQSDCLFKELAIFMNDCDQLQQCLNLVKEEEKRSWASLVSVSGSGIALDGKPQLSQQPSSQTNSTNNAQTATHFFERTHFVDNLLASEASKGYSLPANLVQEISRMRDAHNRLWSALEENQAVINEFESLSVDSSPAV